MRRNNIYGVLVFGLVLAFVAVIVLATMQIEIAGDAHETKTDEFSIIFTEFILPFELLALLLTAALVGAIVVAKKEVPE